MKRYLRIAAVLALLFGLGVSVIRSCEFAKGYFYQVTNLRGTVVGSNFPVLDLFRWFRQAVKRPKAKLTLYEYCWPCDMGKQAPVKAVVTNDNGKFDFGNLAPSHYNLRIVDEKGGFHDWFDVEVKGPANPTQFVTIDISSVRPDCSGGHKFWVRDR